MNSNALQHLFAENKVRRGRMHGRQAAVPGGHEPLDSCLPGGGYPLGALTELLYDAPGCGEVTLLLPLLSRLTRGDTRIALVAPPHLPYAPALAQAGVRLSRLTVVRPGSAADGLWAAAQLAGSGLFGAVLCWSSAGNQQLRRLQLAAERGGRCLFLYRFSRAAWAASPAALRLRLEPGEGGVDVSVLKCRGPAGARVHCRLWRQPCDLPATVFPHHSANDAHALALSAPAAAGD